MRIFTCLIIFALLSACKSTSYIEKHQYSLQAPYTGNQYTPTPLSLSISDTITEAPYRNNEFLYRLKDNQIKHDFYHLFATSPDQQITHNTITWLQDSNLFAHVASASMMPNTQYLSLIHI